MDDYDITLKASFGERLSVKGANLFIKRFGSAEEVMPISNITSISLAEPSRLSNGSITISTQNSPTIGVNIGMGILAALGSKIILSFKKIELDNAIKIRDYILNILEQQSPVATKAPTVTDELRELKHLLDEGILTPNEFDKKKKQLLGI